MTMTHTTNIHVTQHDITRDGTPVFSRRMPESVVNKVRRLSNELKKCGDHLRKAKLPPLAKPATCDASFLEVMEGKLYWDVQNRSFCEVVLCRVQEKAQRYMAAADELGARVSGTSASDAPPAADEGGAVKGGKSGGPSGKGGKGPPPPAGKGGNPKGGKGPPPPAGKGGNPKGGKGPPPPAGKGGNPKGGGKGPGAPPAPKGGGKGPGAPPAPKGGGKGPGAPPASKGGGKGPGAPPTPKGGGKGPGAPPASKGGGKGPGTPPAGKGGGKGPGSDVPMPPQMRRSLSAQLSLSECRRLVEEAAARHDPKKLFGDSRLPNPRHVGSDQPVLQHVPHQDQTESRSAAAYPSGFGCEVCPAVEHLIDVSCACHAFFRVFVA